MNFWLTKLRPTAPSKRIIFAFFSCALIFFILALQIEPVQAHANLLRSQPGSNESLDVAPNRIIIWFTEPIEPNFSTINVLNHRGESVDLGNSLVDNNDPTILSVEVNPLDTGTYTVAWRNLSTIDGHIVRGSYVFAVGETVRTENTSPTMQAQPLFKSPLEPILKWLALFGSLSLVGGILFQVVVSKPTLWKRNGNQIERQLAIQSELRSFHIMWLSGAVLLIASTGQLLLQVMSIMDIPIHDMSLQITLKVCLETHWGQMLIIRTGLLSLTLLSLVYVHRYLSLNRMSPGEISSVSYITWAAVLILGCIMLGTFSMTSHGAATLSVRNAALISDYLHLLAAAFWIGSLFHIACILPLLFKTVSTTQRRNLLARLIPRFSFIAISSFFVLIITGLYGSWAQIVVPMGIYTPYGWTLIAKIGVVLTIAIIGAINLFTIKPRLQSNDSSGNWLRRLILIEVGLALVILCLVGILTSLQPGRQVASQQAQEAQKQITLQDASEGLDIALRIEPGRVGVNNIYISLTDQRNNLPKNITDLELTLSYVDKDIGSITETVQKVDTGQYILKNQLISLIGTWQIETVVRQSDNFDARTAFRFQVNAPLGNFEDFTPSRELGRLLWGIELILIGFLFILTGIPIGGWWKPQGALIMGSGLTAFILGIFLAVSTDFFSSEPSTVLINPFPPTNESLTIGRQIYKLRCQSCHGIEGLGDGPASYNLNPRPADLSVHVPLHPEAALFDFVKHGIPGTAMLPLEDELTDDEIWHTINHVKTLGVTDNGP